ncbi:hypothetical protein AKJ09_08066 [Labilithrix luteola]|uniref:Peptidase C45 hydrolase domain-containing protein n=1 Tax=Labilithrix luteola TaxID=1391654 RepID=A0A0K1Q6P0_9BACT|nr:C45 family peptidase [Labilithrix luteola]AKV01403.1 hypothetical protein AKJ09_08066 [Labilithrix luteola]
MNPIPELTVDLNVAPEKRWEPLESRKDVARELLAFYLRDLGGAERFASMIADYGAAFVDEEYRAEMRGIARLLDVPEQDVLLANLYYDALKLVLGSSMGCTAFAVDTPHGPLHARNLDWTTANGRLAAETILVNFVRDGAPLYRVVGWPGFTACLSGVAPGRFAVTLNAVLGDDPPELATPVSFLLRRALETAEDFDAAIALLRDTPVVSDSLLLVTGTKREQMAVIERAPKRAAVRGPYGGWVLVTNDYRALAAEGHEAGLRSALGETSCGRFDRARAMLRERTPHDAGACMEILRDRGVKMAITVQHMVLSAATGQVMIELPA